MIENLTSIPVEKIEKSRIDQVDFNNLKFGQILSDHMLVADYIDGKWQNVQICPYGNLSLSPAISALHYGQAIFEGIKAYKFENGDVNIFRPDQNFERFNKSARRMMMPEVPVELFLDGMKQLINLDRNWVPNVAGASLYVRPYMFATEAALGVHPSNSYKFIILTGPVGKYYTQALKMKVETHYSRASEGGVGFSKNAGNYALSLLPTKLAQDEGYDQLIWTDAKTHKFVEEAGTANLIFRVGDTIITPSSDTILHSITRKTVVDLAKKWGYQVEERNVSVEELLTGIENGTVTDAFAAGTAATIAPIGEIGFEGKTYTLPALESRDFSNRVSEYLTDLRYGKIEDEFGWNFVF